VCDFSVQDLRDLLVSPRFSRVYRPDILCFSTGTPSDILKELESTTAVNLDQDSVEVLANSLAWIYIASVDGEIPRSDMAQQLVETLVRSLILKSKKPLTAFDFESMGFIFVHALQKHFCLSEDQQWSMLTAFVKGAAAAFRVKNLSFGRFVTSARS